MKRNWSGMGWVILFALLAFPVMTVASTVQGVQQGQPQAAGVVAPSGSNNVGGKIHTHVSEYWFLSTKHVNDYFCKRSSYHYYVPPGWYHFGGSYYWYIYGGKTSTGQCSGYQWTCPPGNTLVSFTFYGTTYRYCSPSHTPPTLSWSSYPAPYHVIASYHYYRHDFGNHMYCAEGKDVSWRGTNLRHDVYPASYVGTNSAGIPIYDWKGQWYDGGGWTNWINPEILCLDEN